MKTQPAAHPDVYQIITDRIIAELEHDRIPWRQPWSGAGQPANLITKRPYRGINVLLLSNLAYEANYFIGWHQLQAIGGSVQKGEKGHLIVFWKPVAKSGQEETENEEPSFKAVLRYHKVFNVSQCVNIPAYLIPQIEQQPHSPIAVCEEIISRMPNPPAIAHEGRAAAYYPLDDRIRMPQKDAFESAEAYYSVLFHELVHSTGHCSRLNRKEITGRIRYGSEQYAIEELTAEIGAAFLQSTAGLQAGVFENSLSYISYWLRQLKNDKRLVAHASSRAQRAVDYITNVPLEDWS